MSSSGSKEQEAVAGYQLRFRIIDVQPIVWRRLLVRADNTLEDLHYAIQICCNWSDDYLHQFKIYGQRIGVPRLHGPSYTRSANKVKLSDLELKINQRFLYEYNFFVFWQLEIRVEKPCAVETKHHYPRCIDGKRKAPPDNCGGVELFHELKLHYSPFFICERLLKFYRLLEKQDELTEEERYELDDRRSELRRLVYWAQIDKFERRPINQRLKKYATNDKSWREVEGVIW